MVCQCNERDDSTVLQEMDLDMTALDGIVATYGTDRSKLIAMLQEIQEAYGFLPETVLMELAVRTGIKPAKIYGVATFYSQFRMNPVGKHLIMLCQGTACHVNGSARIELAIKEHLGVEEGEITEDGLFTYVNVACLGCCSLAPVMMIDDQTHARLTPDKVASILSELRDREVAN